MTYRSLTAISTASDDYLRERSETDRLTELGVPAMVLYDSQDKRWQPDSFEDYRRVRAFGSRASTVVTRQWSKIPTALAPHP
ncbi:hypothetical protein [Nocardia gipuzkoensis]